MQVNLYIGPIRGREKGLHKYSAGLLSNPMLQFEASLIPISTIGDYLWNSQDYDPEISWEAALIKVIPNDVDRAALRKFFRTSLGSNVGGDPAPDLRQVFRAGVTAWRAGEMNKAADIFAAAGKDMETNFQYLTSGVSTVPELISEITPWLAKYRVGGEALVGLAEVLRTCTYDKTRMIITGPAEAPAKLEALVEKVESVRKRLFGDQIVGPLNELAAELQTYSS
jgi:hyaluronoglucosaminidase